MPSTDGVSVIRVFVEDENIWVMQSDMAEIFDIDVSGITRHLKSVFETDKLDETNNVQKMHIASSTKSVKFNNLDTIISVGYRVNSYKTTQFKIWATGVLKEHMLRTLPWKMTA